MCLVWTKSLPRTWWLKGTEVVHVSRFFRVSDLHCPAVELTFCCDRHDKRGCIISILTLEPLGKVFRSPLQVTKDSLNNYGVFAEEFLLVSKKCFFFPLYMCIYIRILSDIHIKRILFKIQFIGILALLRHRFTVCLWGEGAGVLNTLSFFFSSAGPFM